MKRLMIAAVLTGALTCAADSSYTYSAGDTGSGAVSITYDEGTTNIKTLTANTAGDTVAISGDAMTFADGATITLASSGTVSFAQKVTTLGATTLARGDDAYRVWTGAAMTVNDPSTPAFPDIYTNDTISAADVANTWECIHVIGGEPASASGKLSAGRYDRIAGQIGSGSFVTLNRTTVAFTYSIRVQLSPKANGTYVRCRTGVRTPRRGLWPDLEDRWPTADLWDQNSQQLWGKGLVARADRGIFGAGESDATTYGGEWLDKTSAMGLNTVILKRKSAVGGPMKVRFDGGAEIGGTTTIPFGMEAIVAVDWLSSSAELSNTFTGTGDITLVPMSTPAGTNYMDGLISTSWQVLAENRSLSSMTNIVGYLQGSSHNAGSSPSICTTVGYRYDPANDTATCQFHYKRSNTSAKYVAAKFRQNGRNVEIAGVGGGYTEVGTGGASAYPEFGTVELPQKKGKYENCEVMAWYDTVATLKDESLGYVAGNYTGNYGIRKITAAFGSEATQVSATISGNVKTMYGGKIAFSGTANTKLTTSVTSANGLPAAGEAHVSDGTLWLAASGAPGGGTTKIVAHRDGELRNLTSWQFGNPCYQELVLDGGTLFTGSGTDSEAFYIYYATLSNAVLHGTYSPRVGYNSSFGYWRVIGTEPTTVLDGGSYWINTYGYKDAATARSNNCAFRVEVQDVTGDDEADFIVPALRGGAGRTSAVYDFIWFWFEKYGPGTIKVKGNSKDLKMESKLYGGTLLLAGDNIMTNEVQFLGGGIAVEAGKHNDNLGALTASKAGTITVGAGGSIGFASFVPDSGLPTSSVKIEAPIKGNFVKFGTQLTAVQRSYFRWQDDTDVTKRWKVKQDAEGYLHPIRQGTTIAVR